MELYKGSGPTISASIGGNLSQREQTTPTDELSTIHVDFVSFTVPNSSTLLFLFVVLKINQEGGEDELRTNNL